ncbi:hypothetical protein B0T24DRAFT_359692 [Lasiosphaeria ovina]|uniref:Uncharacterized protein n=1 Tax=Lasiosphaeria ovina TaxID=92902 RepID=A0AAE0K3D5_9PEZI|nr:hypothetical protein B0T24DRAFT_359692 [Lasiosphaeria ovina]
MSCRRTVRRAVGICVVQADTHPRDDDPKTVTGRTRNTLVAIGPLAASFTSGSEIRCVKDANSSRETIYTPTSRKLHKSPSHAGKWQSSRRVAASDSLRYPHHTISHRPALLASHAHSKHPRTRPHARENPPWRSHLPYPFNYLSSPFHARKLLLNFQRTVRTCPRRRQRRKRSAARIDIARLPPQLQLRPKGVARVGTGACGLDQLQRLRHVDRAALHQIRGDGGGRARPARDAVDEDSGGRARRGWRCWRGCSEVGSCRGHEG